MSNFPALTALCRAVCPLYIITTCTITTCHNMCMYVFYTIVTSQ